jgi:hypothetical protein
MGGQRKGEPIQTQLTVPVQGQLGDAIGNCDKSRQAGRQAGRQVGCQPPAVASPTPATWKSPGRAVVSFCTRTCTGRAGQAGRQAAM